MVSVLKKELDIDEDIKKNIDFICGFCNAISTFINGSIRTIEHTNLTYIEPHRVIIRGISFLFFNYSNDFYVEILNNRILVNAIQQYLKNIDTIDFSK